jgi:hypothetical protein
VLRAAPIHTLEDSDALQRDIYRGSVARPGLKDFASDDIVGHRTARSPAPPEQCGHGHYRGRFTLTIENT